MSYPFIAALSIICYLFATALLIYQLRKKKRFLIKWLIIVGVIGFMTHAITFWFIFNEKGSLNFSLFNMGSLVSLTIVGLILLSSLFKPTEIMGLLFFPMAVVSLILSYAVHGNQLITEETHPLFVHITLSIIAYSLLSIAAVQALLVWFQNKQLHNHNPAGLLQSLPPLQTMEAFLFEIIALGYLFLTASLISGFFDLENIFTQRLAHKTILGILSWGTFSILLWGRYYHGWRGRLATRWVLSGFAFLMLGYFGSKIAKELIFS